MPLTNGQALHILEIPVAPVGNRCSYTPCGLSVGRDCCLVMLTTTGCLQAGCWGCQEGAGLVPTDLCPNRRHAGCSLLTSATHRSPQTERASRARLGAQCVAQAVLFLPLSNTSEKLELPSPHRRGDEAPEDSPGPVPTS